MYFIEQTEGKLRVASMELKQAVRDGNMERAREIYGRGSECPVACGGGETAI
jgi:hypothetical protein